MISLEVREVCFSYFDGDVLHDISLRVEAGERVGLLGANGSGKTTFLKLVSGILKPKRGDIRLDGSGLSGLSREDVARNVAVVPQQFHIPFAFTTAEVVMLGRTPFLKAFSEESRSDRQIVDQVLEEVDIANLGERLFNELSGGEQQKIILAMALAQQPKLLILDEPTVHLDIAHQVEMLELVRNLNCEAGITIIAAMHDLNLAALYFDRLVMFRDGRVAADGPPTEVLTEAKIEAVFSTQVKVEIHPDTGRPHIVIHPRKL